MIVPFCDLDRLHAPLRADLRKSFDRVLRRGRFILGPEVETFEETWARYCHRKHAAGVASGLDALILMLKAHGIGSGAEVLVASNTFAGTWMAVSSVGATPVPVEPDNSMTMAAGLAGKAITDKTRAILTTHLYGNVSDMGGLRDLAKYHSIPLLVDACQAHGVVGTDLGDSAAFSFYPTKNLGCLGDGGAVVTDSIGVDAKVRELRNYGGQRKDEHRTLGHNSRLDELQAAILNVKVARLDEWNRARSNHAEIYDHFLERKSKRLVSVNHIYPIMTTNRDELRAMLAAEGVATMVHYPTPPHLQPVFAGWFKPQPVAEFMCSTTVSLPVGPEVSAPQVEFVAKRVKHWVAQHSKTAEAV